MSLFISPIHNFVKEPGAAQNAPHGPTGTYHTRHMLESMAKVFSSLSAIVYMIYSYMFAKAAIKLSLGKRVSPQSDTAPESGADDKLLDFASPAEDTIKAQNVQFHDAHPGEVESRGAIMDTLRDYASIDDASLETFFSRPIKISTILWGVGNSIFENLDPWSLYWQDPRVNARISNYKLLHATMKVKFVINGNAFHYGRAIASYAPLAPTFDTLIKNRFGTQEDVVAASQRPHVFLNPTDSQGGELELPFFTPLNVLDIVNQEWNTMGTLNIRSLNNLKMANGGDTPVTISVFAWAENVSFSVPTQFVPGEVSPTILPQSDTEYKGIISKPASVVANLASKLTTIPEIGPFAKATEIGASAIASMANLWGYSKPRQEEMHPFQPIARQSMANTDGPENIITLVADSKNQLTVDPRIGGINPNDELTVNGIAGRESYLTTFNWAQTALTESLLFNIVVDPGVSRQTQVANNVEYHMPACCFASLPFQYWTGTMRYRFQIVASSYHKGRLKFVWDPFGTPRDGGGGAVDAHYNTAYTEILDIADKTDFTIDVGWGQNTPFREVMPLDTIPPAQHATAPLSYYSNSVSHGNGTLSVYVVNDLTSPDDTINNDISINVFVSAGPNFQVASPTDKYLPKLRLTPAPITRLIEPQSDVRTGDPATVDTLIPSTDPENVVSFGSSPRVSEALFTTHMGEVIPTFRSLLKRYNLHEALMYEGTDFGNDTGLVSVTFVRPAFPYTPGYPTTSPTNSVVSLTATGQPYYYANLTLMNYLAVAFGGWRGGVRYTTDVTSTWDRDETANTTSQYDSTWSVSRIPTNGTLPPQNSLVSLATGPTLSEKRFNAINANRWSDGNSGLARWNTHVNPLQSYEIPYYSKYRFTPSRRISDLDTIDGFQPSYKLTGNTVVNLAVNMALNYVAAAEDFQLLFFLGAPVFYYEPNLPTPAPL